MVPVYVKGGSWSNIEDQTLKAAVSKYGLNQWHRVASLLARKTAKQAKARWNEYLDPRIRKSDWTQEEDVKLLELARLLPNQWRSIASMIGRTATQCIERYQKLLDDEGSSELTLSGPGIETLESVGASKDLQIGDINVNAETKDARPDAVDLDDDEREMLSEARARLANTRGKKATRKARERMLEESKRIALLQKRRDLKQAGITTKLRAPKKKFANQMDYTKDIPFEHTPTSGFYDTTEETVLNERTLKTFERQVDKTGVKDDKKEKKRNRDERKEPKTVIEKEAVISEDLTKRRKLDLPEPVFGDEELQKLSKDSVDTLVKERITDKEEAADDRVNGIARKIKESKIEKSALLTTGEIEDLETEEKTQLDNDELPKPKLIDIKSSLRSKLMSLPKPKNDFEILEDEDEEQAEKGEKLDAQIVEDAGEKERLRLILEETERQTALLRRSRAVQSGLDIPNIDGSLHLQTLNGSILSESVDRELLSLIRSDYSKTKKASGVPLLGDLDEHSKELVDSEISKEIVAEELSQFQKEFSLAHQSYQEGKENSDNDELVSVLTGFIEKTNKLERKLELKFGGYLKRSELLLDESVDLVRDLKEVDRALAAFTMLQESEKIVINARSEVLKEQVDELVQAEHGAQERYLELKRNNE